MPIQQIASFQTTDGKTFATLEEAEAHQLSLDLDGELDAALAKHDINSRTASTLKRWLPTLIAELGYVKAPEQVTFDDLEQEADDVPSGPEALSEAA